MSTEVMIDIETLAVPDGLRPGELVEVVQIGAVKFDLEGIMDAGLSLFPQEDNGCLTGETVTFWLKQILNRSHEVHIPQWAYQRMEVDKLSLPNMKTCLEHLTRYIGTYKATVWSKGAFDLPILAAHYAANGMPCPWSYHKCRDLRTLMKECGVSQPYDQVEHDALGDCLKQVELLNESRTCVVRRGVA